jgi:hypothetical protein
VNSKGVLKFTETKGLADERLVKVTTEVDNLSIPYQKVLSLGLSEKQADSWPDNYGKKEFKHLNRFSNDAETSKIDYLGVINKKTKQADLFTYELGMQDFIEFFESGGFLKEVSFLTYDREGYFPEDAILKSLISKGAKGVIANVPEVRNLPYFTKYQFSKLKATIGSQIYIKRYTNNDVRLAVDGDVFLPNKIDIDNLLEDNGSKGLDFENPILDEDVIGIEERWSVKTYNTWIERLAADNKLPIVNLYGLYEKIIKGEYITDDGIKVNGAYPEGNFFSSDGINPTAFGQAIIANEYIKVINKTYGSKIPFVITKSYIGK